MIRNKYIFILLFCVSASFMQAQRTDSLSLHMLINQVFENYPALKKTDKDLIAIDAKIGLTKTAYLPDVNFSATYSRVGPTTSITMPINGVNETFSLFPENVYNATLSLNQNIYDFGKTQKNVALDQQNKEMVLLTVDQTKQRLSTAVMAGYYTISYLNEAIRIKNEQLNNLKEHLNFVQKKAETGSALRYDITTTKVRISIIENQITDLETALNVQTSQLNSFLGNTNETKVMLKQPLYQVELLTSTDSLLQVAYRQRSEMKMALQKEEVVKSKLAVVQVQNNPSLNFFASGGYKNGYLNTYLQDVGKLNFAVGVGLKVPVFDANRKKYIKIQTNAELEADQQETEVLRRNISNEIVEDRANVLSAFKKVNQSCLQLEQAQQAYELATVNYQAGTITNLDLLDSFNQLAESKLMVYKTKIDYSVSLTKLKLALGEKLY